MIVFCTGMPRSASTWSFNVCVQLISEAFPGRQTSADYHEEFATFVGRLSLGYDHLVLKSHALDDLGRKLVALGAAKAVYTYRDPLDAIASYMAMFGRPFEEALAAIQKSLALFQFLRDCGNCRMVSYGSIVERPFDAVQRVKSYLGLDLPVDVVQRVSSGTSMSAMKRIADEVGRDSSSVVQVDQLVYDRRTLLHKQHIRHGGTGYGRSVLSAEQLRLAGKVLGDDLADPEREDG